MPWARLGGRTIELRQWFGVVWRRRWIVLGTTAAVVAIALAIESQQAATYEASTTVRLVARAALSDQPVRNDDIVYLDRLENTYVELLTGTALRNQVRDTLGLTSRPKLRGEPRANTELLDIVAEAPTPALAMQTADAAADALIEQVRALNESDAAVSDQLFAERIAELEAEIGAERARLRELVGPANAVERATLQESIRSKQATVADQRTEFERNRLAATTRASALGVVTRAEMPTTTAAPGRVVYGALGLIVGLIGGLGLAFLVENLRPRLHNKEAVESASDIPVLGEIPTVRDELAPLFNGASGAEGAFALLRTNILAGFEAGHTPVVVVASNESGEGKSTVTANLALSMAASNRTVVVVDGDLRRPTIHEIFDTGTTLGLADVLARRLLPADAVTSTHTPGLYVMPAGMATGDPTALLGSEAMAETITALSHRFDAVLIDSPSLVVPDALALAHAARTVVLVTRRGRLSPEELRTVSGQTSRAGARLLGVVLNGMNIPPLRRVYASTARDVEHV